MARIRTIKPAFWKHEDLSELPAEAHMLAAALLNYADDEGYFNANPKLVKAECCPLREDSMSVQDSLSELVRIGYVKLYNGTDGKTYGHVVKFSEHQNISRKTESKIKDVIILNESSVSDNLKLIETSIPEGKGREEEENKEEDTPVGGSGEPSGDESLEAKTYRRGKEVLGKKSGGLITKLRRHCENDLLHVLDIIDQAEEKSNPLEWIGGVLKNTEQPRTPEHVTYPPETYRNVL